MSKGDLVLVEGVCAGKARGFNQVVHIDSKQSGMQVVDVDRIYPHSLLEDVKNLRKAARRLGDLLDLIETANKIGQIPVGVLAVARNADEALLTLAKSGALKESLP